MVDICGFVCLGGLGLAGLLLLVAFGWLSRCTLVLGFGFLV